MKGERKRISYYYLFCTFQQATMLHDLGCFQDLPVVYCQNIYNYDWGLVPNGSKKIKNYSYSIKYAAYSLADLRIMLEGEWKYKGRPVTVRYKKNINRYCVCDFKTNAIVFKGRTEAEATAWLLIAKLKTQRMSLEKCNERLQREVKKFTIKMIA
jgi:hypothetical protein